MEKEKNFTIDDIKKVLIPLFFKNNVKSAVLFGSYAKNSANEHSDVDLLVDSSLKGLAFVALCDRISDALGKEVDVFDVAHIVPNSKIQNEIERTGLKIYG